MQIMRDMSDRQFEEERLAGRENIFEAIRNMKTFWQASPKPYTEAYCIHAEELLDEFGKILSVKTLFDAPAGRWTFSVVMRASGIFLELNHDHPEEHYSLFGARAKLITAEEYAQMNGLAHPAAVSRIRRGKIRSACKVGKQWRIPELAEPIERGYSSASYVWDGKLSGIPETYRVLENYQRVDFFQDDEKLSLYHVRMTQGDGTAAEFTCEREQRARIEQVLIAHPDVRCMTDEIMRISFRNEPCRLSRAMKPIGCS